MRLRQAAQQVLLRRLTVASAEALVKALVSQTWRDPQWSDSWRQKCWRLEAGGWRLESTALERNGEKKPQQKSEIMARKVRETVFRPGVRISLFLQYL